jgi:hypothetical protein
MGNFLAGRGRLLDGDRSGLLELSALDGTVALVRCHSAHGPEPEDPPLCTLKNGFRAKTRRMTLAVTPPS